MGLYFIKDFCLFYSQINALLFFSRALSNSDLVKKSSENRERQGKSPSSLLNSSLLVEAGMDTIQSCFLGSGIYPLSVKPHPYACRTVQSSSAGTSPY